jgi:hypothetical protein
MEMRINYLSAKLSFLLLIPILANAQLAPGEDPVYLNEKIVVNMLPINNTMRSTPLQNSTGVPAWMDARIARFEAKAYSFDTTGIFTDKDVSTTTIRDGFRKTCIQNVGSTIAAAANSAGKFGAMPQDQIVVLKGDLVNICR